MKNPKHMAEYVAQVQTCLNHYNDGLYSEAELVQALHVLTKRKSADLIERYQKRLNATQIDINNLIFNASEV